MESCIGVEKEVDKVLQKFGSVKNHSERVFDETLMFVDQLRETFSAAPEDSEITPGQAVLLKDALSKTREKLQCLVTDHRDLHSTVSKVGKAIDRHFLADFTTTQRGDVSTDRDVKMLDNIIVAHFNRQGMDDIAQSLIKEANLKTDTLRPEPFAELHRIWECVLERNLAPALEWASRNSAALDEIDSSLEFKLHRLQFIQILNGGVNAQTEAIYYARTNFQKFVDRHEKEIQMLMGTLIYLPMGIDNSPYKNLMQPEMWVETADTFLRDSCKLIGIIKDSPLAVICRSGAIALPALLNLKQVMQSRHVVWGIANELPIEVDLEQEHRYHSIFACPILRQQSSEENPPMKLFCGHVISRDAMNKLTTNAGAAPSNFRIKCPYCPVESSAGDARMIVF